MVIGLEMYPMFYRTSHGLEKILISRVCHNRCVVRVSSSGMHKLAANAVFFHTNAKDL